MSTAKDPERVSSTTVVDDEFFGATTPGEAAAGGEGEVPKVGEFGAKCAIKLSALMPFWMLLALAFVKPLATIFILGPPKGTLDIECESLNSDEAALQGESCLSRCIGTIKREVAGTVFLCLAAVGTFTMVYKLAVVIGASDSVPSAMAVLLVLLANTPGIVSMVNISALVTLYSDDEFAGAFMLMGPRDIWILQVLNQHVSHEGFQLLLAVPLRIFIGGMWAPLDRDAVARIPSVSQRYMAGLLWAMYKPLYHLLVLAAVPGAVAYFWVWALMFLALHVLAFFAGKFAVGALLRLRITLLGRQMPRGGSLELDNRWAMYLFIPSFFALFLPICVPLTLRLFSGYGYWGALYAAWDERHAMEYFGELASTADSTMSDTLLQVDGVNALLQSSL